MADVFEVLSHDHNEVKRIFSEFEAGVSALGGGDDRLAARRKLAEQLVVAESQHEAVEEQFFWPMVREFLDEGDQLADQAIEQEQQGKQVLDDLRKSELGEHEFDNLVAKFINAGREHIAFEEEQVWPGLRAALNAQQSDLLATKIEQAKVMAPTRPHPHTPPKPGVLKTAGMGAAAADKVRDAVAGFRSGRRSPRGR
jgi:hemerythrin-like domain-containing protein